MKRLSAFRSIAPASEVMVPKLAKKVVYEPQVEEKIEETFERAEDSV